MSKAERNPARFRVSSRAIGTHVRTKTKRVVNGVAGHLAAGLLKVGRRLDWGWTGDVGAAFMRAIGPRLREHRIGRANLRAAFPEKSAEEIETILRGVWDNLGRVAGEFAHLDRICGGDPLNSKFLELETPSIERFMQLRSDGKPALIFAAHLANWELPAIIAHYNELKTTVLYRRPNLSAVADAVIGIRQGHMGNLEPAGLQAPLRLAHALEAGDHVAMLVDQHFTKGVEVTFFGRRCMANPLIAKLARHIECPIHGVRVIRMGPRRFRAELSDAIAPRRDAEGRIDVQGTMQAITDVVETWVREHPEQWLWLHRRWR